MDQTVDVLIIHYNTPELTTAAIKSLYKHTPNTHVTIFDNSDRKPFIVPADLPKEYITIIDNTQQLIINWDQWLNTFPNKMPCPENNYGSAKHCYSVDKCLDLFPNGFVLMDSDVLIKQDISTLCDKSKAFSGGIHCNTHSYGVLINRVIPFLCWINVPMLLLNNIRYFNPNKMWKLHKDKNTAYYDTGAWLLEAVSNANLQYNVINTKEYVEHFRHGSWSSNKFEQSSFLLNNRNLWDDNNIQTT